MGSNKTEWKFKIGVRSGKCRLPSVQVQEHPLKALVVTERIPRRILGSQPSTGRTTPTTPTAVDPLSLALKKLDPLSEFALELDPLSKMAAETEDIPDNFLPKREEKVPNWAERKKAILSKYTTSEKISIVTSFLSDGEKVVIKAQSTAVDKVQHRLEQLDYFEESSQCKLDLSQAEYVNRIEQLNKELVSAWNSEQRVKALKIAIQCAKLLADTEVLPFYPSKFVLITDILDTFGRLVFDRLKMKSARNGAKGNTSLPDNFTPDMVPESAKETCLNWFYKIASIRELVPRLYVEMALLKSYRFISTTECEEALLRLTEIIQGIGNPLVAVYARCYLCRIGLTVSTRYQQYLNNNFKSFLNCYQHVSRSVKAEIHKQKLTMSAYMTLYTPALDFILESVANNVPDSVLDDLLLVCKKYGNSSLILNTVMSSFKPSYIAERTVQFLDLIESCVDEGIPLYLLLRTLGFCVSLSPPPGDQNRQILATVWRDISNFQRPEEYISACLPWIKFVVKNFTVREINHIVGDIIDHLHPDRAYEKHYSELKQIVYDIVSNAQDFEALLSLDNFLPLIDLFQEESLKVEVCKNVLNSSARRNTNDPVITNALMYLSGVLHDSVNALTPEDELKQIGDILCSVVRMVDYGRDFEQQLSFYVEARGRFSNIDAVLAQLVQCVNLLSVNTRMVIKGLHTRKTGDFVRACAAYCFITIPSIVSVKTRLELYLLSGQVALFNQCLGQADACFKAALVILPELEDRNETFIISYVKQFLACLILVPDNPEKGVLSLARQLLNALHNYDWNKQNGNLINAYIHVIDYLCTMAQEVYPYGIDKIEANDALYGSDIKFIAEVENVCSVVTGEILGGLKDMGPCRKQSQLAFELFLKIALRANFDCANLAVLAVNLWNLSLKNGYFDSKYMVKSKEYLKKKAKRENNDILINLLDKLEIPK